MLSAIISVMVQAAPVPEVQYGEYQDPITDQELATAVAVSGKYSIAIACRKGSKSSPKVIFTSERYLASPTWLEPQRWLTYRFDKDPPVKMEWWFEKDMAYMESRANVTPFAKRFITASKLHIRTQTDVGDRVDAEFHLGGAATAVRKALAACGDKRVEQSIFPLGS